MVTNKNTTLPIGLVKILNISISFFYHYFIFEYKKWRNFQLLIKYVSWLPFIYLFTFFPFFFDGCKYTKMFQKNTSNEIPLNSCFNSIFLRFNLEYTLWFFFQTLQCIPRMNYTRLNLRWNVHSGYLLLLNNLVCKKKNVWKTTLMVIHYTIYYANKNCIFFHSKSNLRIVH